MKKAGILIAAACLLLTGCFPSNEEAAEYKLYYISEEGDKLATVPFVPDSTDGSAPADALFNKMRSNDWIPEGGKPLTPQGLDLGSMNISRKIVNIDLQGDYASLKSSDKILLLSGLAFTFDQAADTEGVNITINKKPVLDSNEKEIGILTKEDFVENDSNDINTYLNQELRLFYTDENGYKLIPETRNVYYSSNELLQQVILDELIQGPEDPALRGILPSDMSYVSVSVQDDTCYVNFAEGFLNASFGADFEHVIYSIVNSIAFNCDTKKIKFSVNGTDAIRQDGIDLSQVFNADLSLSL